MVEEGSGLLFLFPLVLFIFYLIFTLLYLSYKSGTGKVARFSPFLVKPNR